MATEEQPEQTRDSIEETTDLASFGTTELDTTGIATEEMPDPTAPKDMSEAEAAEVQGRAAELVAQLKDASGSNELEIIDGMTNLGIQAQRNSGGEMELLRGRVGQMIQNDSPGGSLTKDLVELRVALNQINPNQLSEKSGPAKFLSFIPFLSPSSGPMKVLARIAVRYEPVSKQVTVIESRLREGRAMLARDNVEMRKLYEQVEEQQGPIQKNAYLGELIAKELTDLMETEMETLRQERMRSALHDVMMRVQDLRTMETVHTQFFVSLEMSRQNNNRLGQAVERTLALAINVVTVGLAIQTGLARQKRVLEATQRTREFLGELITQNAAAIKQHTEEIGDLYNNPVVAIDKITQAHNDLIEAMDTADRLKQEGIESARTNIATLSQLSAELNERSSGLREKPELAEQSVEA